MILAERAKITRLDLPSADVYYAKSIFAADESEAFFTQLSDESAWEHRQIRMFGKWLFQPRLTAWYGDAGVSYTYSGLTWEPLAWTEPLLKIKNKVEAINQRLDRGDITQTEAERLKKEARKVTS